MSGSFIDRIKRGLGFSVLLSPSGYGNLPSGKINAFFKHIAQADGALPKAILRYIFDGANSSVILDLQKQSVQQAWNIRPRDWPPRDEGGLFTDLSAWQIGQMQRFGEVHAAIEPITYYWGHFGTGKSPDWLRYVVKTWLGDDCEGQPIQTLIDLSEAAGDKVGCALDILFGQDASPYRSNNGVDRFAAVAEWLTEEKEAIASAGPKLAADVKASLAAAIGRLELQTIFSELLIDFATGSSKKARTNARQSLTGGDKAVLIQILEARFSAASSNVRAELVDVAGGALGKDGRALFARWRKAEKAAKVISALNRIVGAIGPVDTAATPSEERKPDGGAGYLAVDGSWIETDRPAAAPTISAVPQEALNILIPAMDAFNELLAEGRKEEKKVQWHWSNNYSVKNSHDLTTLAQLLEGDFPISYKDHRKVVDWLNFYLFKHPAVGEFFRDERLSVRHLARLAVAVTNGNVWGLVNDWGGPIGSAVQHRLANGADFRTFFALWTAAGGQDFLTQYLTRNWHGPFPDFSVPLWPLLCDKFDYLDQALGLVPQKGWGTMQPLPGIELLATFPKLPERYRSQLMLLAGDRSSKVREAARKLLLGTPGIDGAIATQLQDSRQEVRALSAEWLAARNARPQARAVRAALKKEKSDLARAAMITALDRMGEDVSAYFDTKALVNEAKAGLAKAKSKSLDWFHFDTLPALSWADGKPVDPILPQWWAVLSAKLKQPGGNALMNLWLDRLAPGQAQKLGWIILTSWMDQDTRRPTDEEANAYAIVHVDARLQQNIAWVKSYPQGADYWPTDRATVFARLKEEKARSYLGSAVDSKGILALASRTNGSDAAQRIRSFLKDHGARTAQAKALLELLASIGSSAALQPLLSAANRSKQKSVQAYAAALIDDIAERNGWSAAQLADRTIPTGGFEPDGSQELELGEARVYRLQLDAQDSIVILNGDGREVKALPGPRVDEEKPLIDAAKKQLSNARKELKQVLTAQSEHLREAMFLQRGWDRSEWKSFIAGHPIVGRIAARLIWQGTNEAGGGTVSFRPLGDGSYTDTGDNDVALEDFATIRLAHSSLLDKDMVAAWRRHLSDYAVEPPFDQIGRDLPVLAERQHLQHTIADREGWITETFKLRGLATKLGYQRGPAGDGGWFNTYEKTYRDADLIAEIEFTGGPLPEENRIAALVALSFRKLRGGRGGNQVALGDVPSVLLAESWRDLHDIADNGSGFDADWKKKAY